MSVGCRLGSLVWAFVWLVASGLANAGYAGEPEAIEFTLSARRAAEQRYNVVMRYEGVHDASIDFSLPVWTPGYYQLMEYAKEVEDLAASDSEGRALVCAKVDDNTWRVTTDGAKTVVLRYAVHAPKNFVADNSLSREQGYVVPTATFLHPVGQLRQPVKLQVEPLAGWDDVATGLEPVTGERFTYTARDFDELYDCPLLMGDLERIDFTVMNIPHAFVGRNLGTFDRAEFAAGMTRMIESASAIVGEIPYKHYTVLAIGPGMGGIEHANSTAISFEGDRARSPTRDPGFMKFVTHEYFHLYNAKRIRPIELGPFDYERECPTRMLWVAEGFTVYYEHVILKRAGLTKREELFKNLRTSIVAFERRPGRLKQSAADASAATWREGPFGAGDDTISCYDKGTALAMLLDFKIRHETQNAKSLDDVMRALYFDYHVKLDRGYTEEEFRRVCERIAGCDFEEFFEYTTTTREIDYPKYLGYAGLAIEMPGDGPREKALQITPLKTPSKLQRQILRSWLGEQSPKK
jgi:predicted metalloprotease with PDZ domain